MRSAGNDTAEGVLSAVDGSPRTETSIPVRNWTDAPKSTGERRSRTGTLRNILPMDRLSTSEVASTEVTLEVGLDTGLHTFIQGGGVTHTGGAGGRGPEDIITRETKKSHKFK